MRVHPINLAYDVVDDKTVICQLCGETTVAKQPTTNHRALHVVHLVREHLAEVNQTFTSKGRSEEMDID